MNKRVEQADAATVVHKSLYAALAAAQSEMGRALKDRQNPHFKSKYADLASVMDACMPALTRHGIAVLQPAYDEAGERYVKTIFVHGESGETAECRVPLIVAKNDMQGYGSAVTYARRYGLMGMAGIAPDDDDGNAAAKAPPPPRQEQKPQGPSHEAINAARHSLANADTLERLKAIWDDLPSNVQADTLARDAANKRKAALSAPPPEPDSARSSIDIGDDEIPF